MKKKVIIPVVVLLLLAVGIFIGWLIYDAYKQETVTPADIESMIKDNADTAFEFIKNEKPLPDNIRGYIIDPERDFDATAEDLNTSALSVFEKVDAILPDTVLIRYTEESAGYLKSAADVNELDVIFYVREDMLKKEKLVQLYETYGVNMICVELNDNSSIKKVEQLSFELNEEGIYLGASVQETLSDEIKASVENSALDFYFVKIDTIDITEGEEVIKIWAQSALKSKSKVYAILRNDLVTNADSNEVYNLLRYTYNYGGFSGCIMYDREKLSEDYQKTATKLYSYNEYFNDVDYTALTLTDFSVKEDYSAVVFSGNTSDPTYPVHVWCTAADSWQAVSVNEEDGAFTVSVPLIYGENKIIVKHKNAMYTYFIDKVVDVMTSQEAVIEGNTVSFRVTAVKNSQVYACVANNYPVMLEQTEDIDSAYALYTGTLELPDDMLHLISEQISYAATYNGLSDIVMCCEEDEITPYDNHSMGNSDFCVVTKNYAETTSTASADDTSDPTCTPQLAGSYSSVSSYSVNDNYVICQTQSGMKLHLEDTRLILGGFIMPENNINLESISYSGNTALTFSSSYPVFVKLLQEPQEYYTGYLERIYNVEDFSAEYVDIIFMDTVTCSQSSEFDLTDSSIFSGFEWYSNSEKSSVTLRLYLKNAGSFNGYSYRYDENGKIIIEFNNNPSSLEGTVIMIDPGHGGYGSPGTNYQMDIYEKDITLSVSQMIADILRENGATVVMTRTQDDAVFLSERVEMIREQNPDIYVSIHCDGSEDTSTYGTHTFYYKSYSMPLASSIHNQLVTAYRNYYYTDTASTEYEKLDRGCKFFPYMVTRVEECPSVLVEIGYLTNDVDVQFLISEGGQKVLSTAVAQGIIDYIVNF